jgi:hypothetical protein
MPTALNLQAWSKTPALNDNIDSTIGEIDDDIPVDALDDKQRGIMAALAKFADDIGGALAAAGSANALEVTTNQAISEAHLTDGYALVVRATAANDSTTVTIAVDGTSAKAIKTADGGLPTVGQITDGMYLMLFFDATADEFRAANLNAVSDTSTSGSSLSSFRAHKNGSNQTISSNGPTKLTFGTEAFDEGSDYNTSTSTWTPPAGTALIHVQAMIRTSPPQDPDRYSLKLYRNGSLYRQSQIITNESEDFSLWLTTIEQVSGSDAFTVYVEAAYDSSYSVRGGSDESWFCGTMV